MAKKNTNDVSLLPGHVIVTVVAENKKEIQVKDMPYFEALKLLKKKSSYSYKFYQQGFCSIKSHKKI